MSDLFIRDADGVLHVVAVSGGKDSSCLAVFLKEQEPRPYNYVCTPTGDELPEMFGHWISLGKILGRRILPIVETTLASRVAHYGALPNRHQRWCTRELKIEPFRTWLRAQVKFGPVVVYVGLRADEEGRTGGDYSNIPGVETRFPLREAGLNKEDVLGFLEQRNIRVPERSDCARCFWQTLGEWWNLWHGHLETFLSAEADEEITGHTWRTPKLDPSGLPIMVTRWGLTYAACWRDTWPVRLADMRKLFEAGRIPPNTKRQADAFRGSCRACSL